MIENRENPSEYFSRNAKSWLSDAYEQAGYNYPTPYHRLRIVRDILRRLENVNKVLDIGCGGGQLAAALAEDGLSVCGIDQSTEMLSIANELIASKSAEVRSRVTFRAAAIDNLDSAEFDALTSMGVIGYLSSDDQLFNVAATCLRSRGFLIVSFRNRLFNLFSLSHRTLTEIQSGEFNRLYLEASDLYKQISEPMSLAFIQQLNQITGELSTESPTFRESSRLPSEQKGQSYTSSFEARQTTPREARETADRCGFNVLEIHGVHPHFAVPGLNQMLPPQVYNRLCDSLIPFESTPLALLWSSVFIGVFQKKS